MQQQISITFLLATITTCFLILNTSCAVVVTRNQSDVNNCDSNEIYRIEGQLKIALFLNICGNFTPISSSSSSYVHVAVWTLNRLKDLNLIPSLQLGLSVFETCTEYDYYNSIFKIFKETRDALYLGTISNKPIPSKIEQFGESLDVYVNLSENYVDLSVKAALGLLKALDLYDNVTVITENREILLNFYDIAKDEMICIRNAESFGTKPLTLPTEGPVVVIGNHEQIKTFLTLNSSLLEKQIIFVLLDGQQMNDFPEGSYVIQPSNTEILFAHYNFSSKSVPFHLLLEVANPIINLVLNLSSFIEENCNETTYKINCLRNKFNSSSNGVHKKLTPSEILTFLKLEAQVEAFDYKIFRVENLTSQQNTTTDILQSFVEVFTYNVFNETITNLEFDLEDLSNITEAETQEFCPQCYYNCLNFQVELPPKTVLITHPVSRLKLRSESWVFALLSISVLGVGFCVAVLIFFVVRFYKRDILEGNPLLTLLLLMSVIFMYSSVVPFTLESSRELKNSICLSRALASTLSFAFALSLLLARSILLATAPKELGFTAHVPGPVQSFLTLFIFAVQGALSLQFVNHCEDIFRGISFIYLMSYNIILLILLVFICPLNTKAQRNYREGKYFTVAVILLSFTWSCWIPGYTVFEDQWKDPVVCLGLISTASILLGTIFIPRTYMMMMVAARDRISNTLPALGVRSSIMDVYRASTQPVYDCINVAAINAAAEIRNGGPPPPPPQPDTYSNLPTPYEEDFDFERCITPTPDKVTRF